jgi:hypothetical protein
MTLDTRDTFIRHTMGQIPYKHKNYNAMQGLRSKVLVINTDS